MRSPRVFIHRYISWVLVAVSVSTIITGYTLSRGLLPDFVIVSYLHRVSELLFIGLIVAHIAYTLVHFKLSLRKTAGKIGLYQKNSIYFMRLAQRISSWVIVFAAMGMILTGLNGYAFFAQSVEDIIPFAPHRIFDVLLVSAIIVHVVIGVRFALMRRRVRAKVARRFTMFLTVSLLLVAFSLNIPTSTLETPQDPDDRPLDSQINVDLTRYSFNSADVQTVRPDIFLPGSFSMFDVLVHLDFLGKVELEYHFNESMNTHVIDSLNGEPTWWYQVIYSGGWIERNVYRMDHYVWKPETSLKFIRINKDRLDTIYRSYAEEVARTEIGGGQLVIPS
ncbi:MAG: hypothetical protein ACW99H_12405, partial [Candidatus Thorarchaeota archaeon]